MTALRKARRAGVRGFTLIEVLVALFVFLAGVTGILALMTTALSMHRDGLQLGRATRQIDDVVAILQREFAQGQHRGNDGQPQDVAPRRLADGSWTSLAWLPPRAEEPPVAEIRVAGTQAGLKTARPLRVVLPLGPLPAQEAERLRAARSKPPEDH